MQMSGIVKGMVVGALVGTAVIAADEFMCSSSGKKKMTRLGKKFAKTIGL